MKVSEQTKQLRKQRLGQIRKNKQGDYAICVGFKDNSSQDIIIQMIKTEEIISSYWCDFNKGIFKSPVHQFLGQKNINKQGSIMSIIACRSVSDIDVEFETGYIACHKRYRDFISGSIKDLYFSSNNCKKGYIGIGKYDSNYCISDMNIYSVWEDMFRRCYNDIPFWSSYKNCYVSKEWFNYQSFAEWMTQNAYKIPNQQMCLDKDILVKHNKEYGPNTCCIVPEEINKMFVSKRKDRGLYPIGVHKTNRQLKDKYISTINRKRLGPIRRYFNTPEEAFAFYKEEKEKYIKYVADIYKDQIPQKVYDALYAYEVEMTD